MMSRIPPVSPASIMLVVRSSKAAGYCRMALARVAPPSTVVRTPVRVFWNDWFSWLAAKISRHCTRGKPASIMTENCRKKTAISLTLTLPEPNVGRANSLPFSRMDPGVICSRRSWVLSISLLGAFRSPLIFSPDAVFPENVNTGMVSLSCYAAFPGILLMFVSFVLMCCDLVESVSVLSWRRCFGHWRCLTLGQQTSAAIDHFLQFILVAGAGQSHFQGDLF